ncbi:MAG: DUF3526 domain-containing protein [Bacteroidota bacterium]
MYLFMFKQFLRTKTCIFGLSIVLLLGLVSILVGKQFLVRQEKAIDEVIEKQAAHIERNLDHHSDDIGLLLYYLKFALVNKATPLAALSIGQSDVHPKVQRVKILTLEGQKYDSDLVNPVKLLYGNLDLGFLIVNVFPLLIIAFTYNLRSEEVESGTWRFVQVMSRSRFRFLFAKLSVRAVLLFSALILLFMLASLILGIPWNDPFFAFLLTAVFYLIFWFVLSYGVVSLGRNSNFNALTLLALWLCLVILLPAALNNFVNTRHPIPEAFSSMIKQRNGYHQKWDTNKRKTLEAFYARYPQFESYGYPPEEGFNWRWYYAMQHLGDEAALETRQLMQEKVALREKISKGWARFVPSLHAQLVLNDLAGTNLSNYTNFLDETDRFHERMRLFFYPKIFSEVNAREINWQEFSPEYVAYNQRIEWQKILLPLLIVTLLLIVVSRRRIQ